MAISAKLFMIERYPEEFPVKTEPMVINPASNVLLQTKVEHLGQSEFGGFTKLNITHDLGENFEGIGYSEEHGRIDDLIHIATEKTFPAFVDSEHKWLISAYSAKPIFNAAFKRLIRWASLTADNQNQLRVKPISIDLAKLKQSYEEESEGPQIKGGWFSRIQLLNVNVAYIGGSDVSSTEDWDRYEAHGLISALRLDFPNEDPDLEPNKILLAKDGAIFSYKHFSEHEFLKIIFPIFDFAKQFLDDNA